MRGDRWRPCGADGGCDAGRGGVPRHRLRPDAELRSQAPDGRRRRPEPDAFRRSGGLRIAVSRDADRFVDRGLSARSVAFVVRGPGSGDVRGQLRARLPEIAQGIPFVACVVAASVRARCAVAAPPPVDRMANALVFERTDHSRRSTMPRSWRWGEPVGRSSDRTAPGRGSWNKRASRSHRSSPPTAASTSTGASTSGRSSREHP